MRIRKCGRCGHETRIVKFIGKTDDKDNPVKLFSSYCKHCNDDFVFRIRENGKGYMRTGNLNSVNVLRKYNETIAQKELYGKLHK